MIPNDRWVVFLQGALAACYAIAALFFLKFWRRSRDRFFLFFALAFAVLLIQSATLTITGHSEASRAPLYGLRAIAFLLIVVALIVKNQQRRDR
jgi:hypothetical protein